jgi:hypothetical protein
VLKVLAFASIACLVGCAQAIITSANWDSGASGSNVETRCEHLDRRGQAAMNATFSKYDGWKLIYISEYTTQNRFGTDAAVCFERAKSS